MKFTIRTEIQLNYLKIFQQFNLDLFKHLKPPLMPLNVIRFDGCKPGDLVMLEVGPLKQKWTSKIVETIDNDNETGFVDIGERLPFPFKEWRHCHRIIRLSDNKSIISDEIEYSSGNIILDTILYIPMYLQFLTRVPQYKSFFNKF